MNSKLKMALSRHTIENREPQYIIERKLGLADGFLSNMIAGRRAGTSEQRKALADYLGVKIHDLFEDKAVSSNG